MIEQLEKDGTFRTSFILSDATGTATNADSTPTVVVFKNHASTADTVTVTDLTENQAGLYGLTYDPVSEVQGDYFALVVSSTIGGNVKPFPIEFVVVEQASVTVYPIFARASSVVANTDIKTFVGETRSITIFPLDEDGDSIDPSGLTLAITIEDQEGTDLETIADGSITKTSTSFTFLTSTANNTVGVYKWSCRVTGTSLVIGKGDYIVKHAAATDA